MENTISAIDNPDLANQLAEEALTSNEGSTTTAKAPVVPPSSGEITLLSGHYNPFSGELISTAQVRELNGADEEAIAKLSSVGTSLLTVLSRATVSIGDKPATLEMLDELLAGDREQLLLEIRKITFGRQLPLVGPCGSCGATDQEFIVDLEEDIEVKKLKDPVADRQFFVDCKVGKVEVMLPNGKAQKKLIQNSGKTSAELDTILLKECVQSINGVPIMNDSQILNLGLMDRRKVLEELNLRNPGPKLSEIKKTCPACSKEVIIPLSLADLFRA